MLIYRVEFRASVIEYLRGIARYKKATNVGPYSNQGINFSQNCPNSFKALRKIGFLGFEHYGQHRKRHPAPQEDADLMTSMIERNERYNISEFHFGFGTINQFRSWFDIPNREMMQECGFYLAVYEVEENDVHLGSTQCVFRLEKAELVSYVELEDI
ncbi:hypothetical protein PS2_005 [Serratia phage PS2]|uniref:Uncharacterized protein n=1 Tax=Serratia phage PS2 TaxID=1481112 RepID=A0A023W6A6_9CAUD|nr:hypothetical protein FF83_gp005 [Serratia phage PS2]AHY25257.1 hypothetical protein PS2_005 [Serratia phage PS2]